LILSGCLIRSPNNTAGGLIGQERGGKIWGGGLITTW